MTANQMYILWAAAIILFGVFEGVTVQLVSIWFMLGSVAALITAFIKPDIVTEVIVFIAVSGVTLVLTRPLVKKKLALKTERTNADRCIGMKGVVIEDIKNLENCGQVKVDGKVWTARSLDGREILRDSVVEIEKIDGVKLIVKNIN